MNDYVEIDQVTTDSLEVGDVIMNDEDGYLTLTAIDDQGDEFAFLAIDEHGESIEIPGVDPQAIWTLFAYPTETVYI